MGYKPPLRSFFRLVGQRKEKTRLQAHQSSLTGLIGHGSGPWTAENQRNLARFFNAVESGLDILQADPPESETGASNGRVIGNANDTSPIVCIQKSSTGSCDGSSVGG